MANFNTLVAALASPADDKAVIEFASLLARLGCAKELRFVHIVDLRQREPAAAEIREQLHAVVAARFDAAARVECDVLRGPVTDRLLAHVTEIEADLVIVGGKRRVLGARIAMAGPCSVAVVPETAPARISHIAIAIDFSDAASETLEWATSLAANGPIRCTAVHVLTHESVDLFAREFAHEEEEEAVQAETMRRIVAWSDRHGVPVESKLVGINPSVSINGKQRFILPSSIEAVDVATTILAEAAQMGADCVVLSTRGRSASASILLGSVAEKIIQEAGVPLLVHKHCGARLGLVQILLGRTGKSRVLVKTG